MGYFANSDSGMHYEAKYCRRCIHDNDEVGCPIWNIHMMFNYQDSSDLEVVLEILIPRTEDKLDNAQCTMFVPVERLKEGQDGNK